MKVASWLSGGLTWADDVGGGLDDGLLHDAEPKVGDGNEPVSEQDLSSPLLEGGEEHSRSRGDGAEVAVGLAELESPADECGEQVVVLGGKPGVRGAEVWLRLRNGLTEWRVHQHDVVPLADDFDEPQGVVGLGGQQTLDDRRRRLVGDGLQMDHQFAFS